MISSSQGRTWRFSSPAATITPQSQLKGYSDASERDVSCIRSLSLCLYLWLSTGGLDSEARVQRQDWTVITVVDLEGAPCATVPHQNKTNARSSCSRVSASPRHTQSRDPLPCDLHPSRHVPSTEGLPSHPRDAFGAVPRVRDSPGMTDTNRKSLSASSTASRTFTVYPSPWYLQSDSQLQEVPADTSHNRVIPRATPS